MLARKLKRLFSGKYSGLAVLQRINRSPARHAVKAVSSLISAGDRRARRTALRTLPEDPDLRDGIASLRRDGALELTPVVDPDLLAEAARESERLQVEYADASPRGHKAHWTSLFDGALAAGDIDQDYIFVRYALQPALLNRAAAFLGELPYLSYIHLASTQPKDDTYRVSQLWHRDYDDVRVVKAFTYLSDVLSPEQGPFHFLPPNCGSKISDFQRAHLPDEEVLPRVAPLEPRVMMAPKHSSFMVDTARCYHMGGRVAPGHARLMFTACYVPGGPIYPNRDNQIRITREPNQHERLALRLG